MGFSQYPTITDELLSAYIDNAVSEDERAAVEAAIANDLEIAWRVESLRSTVSLLGQLADVPLPRSFALNEALLEVGPAGEISRQAPLSHATSSSGSFWGNWLDFWRSGSMVWRNAAAVCTLLLVVFLVGDFAVVSEAPIVQDATVSVARNDPAADSTPAVVDDETAPSAVAMASKSVAQAEEQPVPEPMAAAAEIDGESVEAEIMQPAALAMDSEQAAAAAIVPRPEVPPDSESPNESADTAAQADVAVADESGQPQALSDGGAVRCMPMMLSAASVDAGDVMTESALSTGANAEAVPSSDVVEPLMAAAAEPVSNAASPVEIQPRAMMQVDVEGVETTVTDEEVADEEVADEEAADTCESQDAALPESEQLAAASTQVDAPQAGADATQGTNPPRQKLLFSKPRRLRLSPMPSLRLCDHPLSPWLIPLGNRQRPSPARHRPRVRRNWLPCRQRKRYQTRLVCLALRRCCWRYWRCFSSSSGCAVDLNPQRHRHELRSQDPPGGALRISSLPLSPSRRIVSTGFEHTISISPWKANPCLNCRKLKPMCASLNLNWRAVG